MSHQLTTNQLTFEILLNPSVKEADEARLSDQAKAVLSLFRGRKYAGFTVSTIDLAAIAKQYNARLWEVRRYLAERGECIDLVRRDPNADGVNHYQIVPLSKSTYHAARSLRAT